MDTIDVIDVFDGDLLFHSKAKIKLLIEKSKLKHFFVITLSERNIQEYRVFFSNLNYDKYILTTDGNISLPWLVRFGLLFRKSITSDQELILMSFLYKHRNKKILFHGNVFTSTIIVLLNLYSFKSLNWVCWGAIIRNPKPSSMMQFLMVNLFKRLYRKFERILCLMTEDLYELRDYHNCKNVFLCPYPDRGLEMHMPLVNSRHRVLVGNSGHLLKSYISFAQKLSRCDDLHFTFMINYGPVNSETLQACISPYIPEGSFSVWDELVDFKEYIDVLNSHDIYLCPHEYQSGLGAIYSMIKLEKTICVTGYNLKWMQQLGFVVLSLEYFLENVQNVDRLVLPLSQLQKNKTRYFELFSADRRVAMQDKILSSDIKCLESSNILAYL